MRDDTTGENGSGDLGKNLIDLTFQNQLAAETLVWADSNDSIKEKPLIATTATTTRCVNMRTYRRATPSTRRKWIMQQFISARWANSARPRESPITQWTDRRHNQVGQATSDIWQHERPNLITKC